MTERTLTPPEIDHLLSFFRHDRGAGTPGEVASLDLKRPSRVPRSAVDTLRVRYEQAAVALRRGLGAVLRCDVGVVLESFEQRRFDDWRDGLGGGASGYLVEMQPLREHCMLVVDHAFAFCSIDRLLGGSGKAAELSRELTLTEETVLADVVDAILAAHVLAWQPYATLRPGSRRCLASPSFFRDLRNEDAVLVGTYRLEGFSAGARLRFAMPLSELEPHLQHEPRGELESKMKEARHGDLRRQLERVDVGLTVLVGEARLTVRDLLALEPGDVVVTGRRVEDDLDLLVQGRPKFRGRAMRRGPEMVFTVTGTDEPRARADSGEEPQAFAEGEGA